MADRGQGGMDIERQILEDQAGANVLVGRVMAKENNSYPHLSMELTAANSQTQAFRVAPQQWHDLTIAAADTVRGLDWSAGQDLVVREISAEYTPGKCKKSIIFEPYTLGPTGVTGDYPITPEEPPTEEPPVASPFGPLCHRNHRRYSSMQWYSTIPTVATGRRIEGPAGQPGIPACPRLHFCAEWSCEVGNKFRVLTIQSGQFW